MTPRPSKAIDMTGYKTQNARVIGRVTMARRTLWALECVCGNVFRAEGSDIRRRPRMSCGCRGIVTPRLKKSQTLNLCRCCPAKSIRYRGLCRRCYSRARTYGVLEEVALPPKPNGFEGVRGDAHPAFKGTQTEEERGYDRVHKAIRRKRGKAAEHPCAEGCGQMATHWSYDGYCPGERLGAADGASKPFCEHPRHYQSRCLPCHRDWDRDAAYVSPRAGRS